MAATSKQTRVVIETAYKDGKPYHGSKVVGGLTLFEFDTLDAAGWIKVSTVGQENVYFTWTDDRGELLAGFCKCL